MIEVERDAEVALVFLDRPKVNALAPELVGALCTCWDELAADPGVGAVVLGSRRPGVFSAGFDLKVLHGLEPAAFGVFIRSFAELYRKIFAGPLPSVAAVNGHAVAGGAILALACDRRVFAQGEGRFGLTEVDLGLPLPPGVLHLLRYAAGERVALEAGLFGRLYGPTEARASGFADGLAAPEALTEAAREEARSLAAKPRRALQAIRQELRAPTLRALEEADARVAEEFGAWWFSPDATARRQAQVEKLSARR
ncbi:MAG: enoyl-CoA hydratase/isomerase family protein [Thermodesulfobacteriota bacterium]